MRRLGAATAILISFLAWQPGAKAATYTPNITNDTAFDWSTPLFAYNFGFNPSASVNGVNFTNGDSLMDEDGNFATGATVSPAAFQHLLETGDYKFDAPMSLTINGLSIGQEYGVQLFFANNGVNRSFNVTLEGNVLFGSSIVLGANTAAGLQVNFTATDTTLNVSLTPDAGNYVVLSAVTVKVGAVPEPSSTAMVVGLFAALLCLLKRRDSARR
ncbi:MAG: hypothetical protein ACREKL_00965 [Chthoniobacterales bacterium]